MATTAHHLKELRRRILTSNDRHKNINALKNGKGEIKIQMS